jgi:hypothetical protein
MSNLIEGSLLAVSVVTNTWQNSIRFYTDALGYQVLEEGVLSNLQKDIFGKNLNKYALLGHQEGSVVRLIETSDNTARPNRIGAGPWDCGMNVFECGTPDVERAYMKVIRNKFGALAMPTQFDCEGPEPLGKILMKSTAFIGPAGEQIFVTQIVAREGGQSLLKEKAVDGINTPANVVLSLKNRQQQQWYKDILGIVPVNDLVLKQEGASQIMGGLPNMGFDMCLMGYDLHRIGMEQHIYEPHNPTYKFDTYPSDFCKTGLASAAWQTSNLEQLKNNLKSVNIDIISEVGLPIRGNSSPKAIVFRGIVGEVLELVVG